MRTNRAHAGLVSGLNIDYFGSSMKLSELGQISVSDGTMILIQLWDKSAVEMVSKEIESSDIGINPSIDGDTIRLVVPPLNEERRIELKKLIKSIGEKCKVSIRNVRREANEDLKKLLKAKEIGEDDEKTFEKKVQVITDNHIKSVDDKVSLKEKEIMTI